MRRKQPDRAFLEELDKLSQQLSPDHFQAIAPGIGFGRPQPGLSRKSPPPLQRPPASVPTTPRAVVQSGTARVSQSMPTTVRPQTMSVPAGFKTTISTGPLRQPPGLWLRKVQPHIIDLMVITLSLGITFGLLGFGFHVLESGHLKNGLVNLLLPIKIMKILGPIKTLLAIYGCFICYWVFFKIMSGRTFGQSLTVRRWNQKLNSRNYTKLPNSSQGTPGV